MRTKPYPRSAALWIALGSLLLGVVVFSMVLCNFAGADNVEYYETDSDGLTYGKKVAAPRNADWPDLVAVLATNGQEGYVYTQELDAASPAAANPEEAVQMMSERNAYDSLRFVEIISEEYPLNSESNADSALSAYQSALTFLSISEPGVAWTYHESAANEFANATGLDLSLLPQGDSLRYYLELVMAKIQEEHTVEIPVYLSDGKTQVGVFRAGT
jgi:hypothetical protein